MNRAAPKPVWPASRWSLEFHRVATTASQLALTMFFMGAGYGKLTAPTPHLALLMTWPSMTPELVVRGVGVVDIAIGSGMSLNLLFLDRPRPLPRLCAIATLWSTAVFALFHLIAGPGLMVALNLVLMALALFVAKSYELRPGVPQASSRARRDDAG